MSTESKFAFFGVSTAANNRRVTDALEELRLVGQELSAIETTAEPKQRAGLCLVYETEEGERVAGAAGWKRHSLSREIDLNPSILGASGA